MEYIEFVVDFLFLIEVCPRIGAIYCGAMSRYIDNQEIQIKGCLAIGNLTINDDNRKFLGKAGCDAVLCAMTRHETNADIQDFGRKAIRQLVANDENTNYLRQLGSILSGLGIIN